MVRRCWLLVALAAGLLALIQTHAGDAKKDQEKLKGTWQVAEFIVSGAPLPEKQRAVIKIIFSEETMKLTGDPIGERNYKYKLDPGKKPKAVDFIALDGPFKDKSGAGIYEFDGDTLKLCMSNKESVARPEEFKSAGGSDLVVLVLKRAKP